MLKESTACARSPTGAVSRSRPMAPPGVVTRLLTRRRTQVFWVQGRRVWLFRPLIEVWQQLGAVERRGEQVPHLLQPLRQRVNRPPIRPKLGIVELLPGDRDGHRRSSRGPDTVRRDQSFDRCVLREVEACPPAPRRLRPFPADQVWNEPPHRAREALHPVPGVVEGVSRSDRYPDLDPSLARHLWLTEQVQVPQRGPEEASEDQHLVPGRLQAGIDVDQGIAGLVAVVARRGPW